MLGDAGEDEEAQGSSSDEQSASEDEHLRPFSFAWFAHDLKARAYFCGLKEGAFTWLWDEMQPEVGEELLLGAVRFFFSVVCAVIPW